MMEFINGPYRSYRGRFARVRLSHDTGDHRNVVHEKLGKSASARLGDRIRRFDGRTFLVVFVQSTVRADVGSRARCILLRRAGDSMLSAARRQRWVTVEFRKA